MTQVKITISPRQAQALRRCLVSGMATLALTPDERDAATHALARTDRALAIHGVGKT